LARAWIILTLAYPIDTVLQPLESLGTISFADGMINRVRLGASRSLRLIALVIGPSLVSGCRITYQENDWEAYDGPGAAHFQAEEMEFPLDLMKDPLEPINRPISVFNYALIYGIVQPIAWVYRHIVPKPARESVGKAFDNALYPARLVTTSCRASGEGRRGRPSVS